jgi:hypothetical protein
VKLREPCRPARPFRGATSRASDGCAGTRIEEAALPREQLVDAFTIHSGDRFERHELSKDSSGALETDVRGVDVCEADPRWSASVDESLLIKIEDLGEERLTLET